tara:strand:+ start:201 stop:995 length:795 start_codon:yes stop_codon:yes gene_type:complete
VQGITEFLPISSSAHLILVDPAMNALGLPVPVHTAAEKLVLDVSVHVGTLVAVILYFARDVGTMIGGAVELAMGRWTPGARLALLIILGTIPVVIVGAAFKSEITDTFRNTETIAWTTLIFGVVLYLADRRGALLRRMQDLRWGHAILIGASQILALVPGVSRSGITMTAARGLGYEREDAAKFSMLLSIPTIMGAGLLAALDLRDMGNVALGHEALLAAALACVSALAAIALLMRWLERAGFTPFVVYRVVLGGALLLWLYAG